MMATKNDDLISRKAAIDRIEAYCNGCDNYNGVRCSACQIADALAAAVAWNRRANEKDNTEEANDRTSW